ALYSNLRFVASASLVALASVVGVLALYPDVLKELLVASAEISDPPAACQQQDWWQLDRSCLSRRGMPWVAGSPESNAVAVPSARRGRPGEAFDGRRVAGLGACTDDEEKRAQGAEAGDASATAGRRGTANPDAAERSRGALAGDASATAARGGTAHRRAAQGSRDAPAGDVTAAAGRRRKTHPEAAARSHGASARDAVSGRGTARSQTCGRGAATRGRSEESNARGSGRETTAHQ